VYAQVISVLSDIPVMGLAVGLKLAVCVGVFSCQDKGGVSISLGKSNIFGETCEPVPVQPRCVPLEASPIVPEGSAMGCRHPTARSNDGHRAVLLTRATRVDISALFCTVISLLQSLCEAFR